MSARRLLLYCAIKQKARAAASGWANVGTPEAFKSDSAFAAALPPIQQAKIGF